MSLLMEALRKAEAAKRAGLNAPAPETDLTQAATERTPTPPIERAAVPDKFTFTTTDDLLALAPREEAPELPREEDVPVVRSAPPALPLGEGDDVLDDYLTAMHEPESDEATSTRSSRTTIKVEPEQEERLAAASMFNAKNTAGVRPSTKRRIQILGGAMVAIMAIVGLTWTYLTNLTGQSGLGVNPSIANYNTRNRSLGDQPAPKPTLPAVVPATNNVATPANGTAANTNPSTSAQIAPSVATPSQAASAPRIPISENNNTKLVASDPQPAPARAGITTPASNLAVPSPVAGNSSDSEPAPTAGKMLSFSRSNTRNLIQADLQKAYIELRNGDPALAYEQYLTLASRNPNNQNVLLGLAAAQMKLSRTEDARATYARLLKLNPQDVLARTGMLQTLATTGNTTNESELQKLHQQFPDVAPLSFALGTIYAQSSRWHEAQGAFFDALLAAKRITPDAVSPDYAFNLAVSLERLGQKRAALEYYKEAEALTKLIKPGFDPARLRQRLSELGTSP